MIFSDGGVPSKDIVNRWLKMVDDFFDGPEEAAPNGEEQKGGEEQKIDRVPLKKTKSTLVDKRIGVHCVAGLGRAPVLVAIAIVNKGCPPAHAIELIRKLR